MKTISCPGNSCCEEITNEKRFRFIFLHKETLWKAFAASSSFPQEAIGNMPQRGFRTCSCSGQDGKMFAKTCWKFMPAVMWYSRKNLHKTRFGASSHSLHLLLCTRMNRYFWNQGYSHSLPMTEKVQTYNFHTYFLLGNWHRHCSGFSFITFTLSIS